MQAAQCAPTEDMGGRKERSRSFGTALLGDMHAGLEGTLHNGTRRFSRMVDNIGHETDNDYEENREKRDLLSGRLIEEVAAAAHESTLHEEDNIGSDGHMGGRNKRETITGLLGDMLAGLEGIVLHNGTRRFSRMVDNIGRETDEDYEENREKRDLPSGRLIEEVAAAAESTLHEEDNVESDEHMGGRKKRGSGTELLGDIVAALEGTLQNGTNRFSRMVDNIGRETDEDYEENREKRDLLSGRLIEEVAAAAESTLHKEDNIGGDGHESDNEGNHEKRGLGNLWK